MGVEKESRWNTETNIVNTENSPRVFKHFETMSFMPTRKAVYYHWPRSRGVIKPVIEINIKMPSWEEIPSSQL